MKKTLNSSFTYLMLSFALLACGSGGGDIPVAPASAPDASIYSLGMGASTTAATAELSDTSSTPLEGENLCGMGFCVASWISDGYCDWACNCIQTEYDGGDCGIFIDSGSTDDSEETDVAVVEDTPVNSDSGPSPDTAEDVEEPPSDLGPASDASTELTFPCNDFIPCAAAWAGDGLCDQGCNCEEANWDGGDCPSPE